MGETKNHTGNGNITLKAGLWYTLCNVLVRGINFLTTPLFTRIMSKGDYGSFSNYASWLSLLMILTTMDLSSSIARAKLDYKDDLDGYISSIQILGTITTAICYLIVCTFSQFFVNLFKMDMLYIHIMFMYLLVSPAFNILQEKHRQMLKYKMVTVLTIVSTFTSMVVSILLVLSMNNKFLGRVIGNTIVLMCLCVVIYIYNIIKGKKIRFLDWKYALAFSVPLIAHSLAGNVLATSDRIIITNICGTEDTALYSVVYSCASIIFLLGSSVNQAWVPWFYSSLENRKYKEIKSATKKYLVISFLITILIILFGPDIVLIFGGKGYVDSIYIVPCIMIGCYYWIMYTFFINIQLYHKKTIGITIKTIVAALFNVVTNIVFVNKYGYEAAAYTTLASYVLLFILHYYSGIKLGAKEYYDLKCFIKLLVISFAVLVIVLITYHYNVIRYSVIGAMLVCMIITSIIYKDKIIGLLKSLVK